MTCITTLKDQFDELYRSGVPQIDQEHAKALELLEAVINSMDEAFHARLQKLIEHCQLQFFEEEAILAAYQVPDYFGHCEEHEALLERLEECSEQACRGRIQSARDWLSHEFTLLLHNHFRRFNQSSASHIVQRLSAVQ